LSRIGDECRRIHEAQDVSSTGRGLGDHRATVGVADQDLATRDRVQRRPDEGDVGVGALEAQRGRARRIAVLLQAGHDLVPGARACPRAVNEDDRRPLGRQSAAGRNG
jgi:hypothetical protein